MVKYYNAISHVNLSNLTDCFPKGDCSPSQFLHYIVENDYRDCWKLYTFIIMGRPGCAGKTWLRNALIGNGFNAFEISEELASRVEYRDNKNHYLEDDIEKTVTIILNRQYRSKF